MKDFNFISQGWECPKCKRIYSPTTIMCIACPSLTGSTSISTTDTPIGVGGFGIATGTTDAVHLHGFIPDGKSSSNTKCKICGKEQWQHPQISYT